VGIAREAVRLAELMQDDEYRAITHTLMLVACLMQGHMREAAVELAWVLQHRDLPGTQDWIHDLDEAAAHITGSITAMPDVPIANVLAIEAEILNILRADGIGDRSLYRIRAINRYRTGKLEEADDLWSRSMKFEPSGRWLSGERWDAMQVLWQVQRAWLLMDESLAGKVEHRFIRSPRNFDHREVAFGQWSLSSLPLAMIGQRELAQESCNQTLRLLKSFPMYTGFMGETAACLAALGSRRKALNLLEKHFQWVTDHGDGEDRFSFFAGAGACFAICAGNRSTVKLRLPPGFEIFDKSGQYSPAELSDWCFARAGEIADAFEARDGNDIWRQRLEYRTRLRPI
jgi:hypothetical protein